MGFSDLQVYNCPRWMTAPMAQWLRGYASELKSHEFEPHRCHLVRAYGRRYVQVRPVRPNISHFPPKEIYGCCYITLVQVTNIC